MVSVLRYSTGLSTSSSISSDVVSTMLPRLKRVTIPRGVSEVS